MVTEQINEILLRVKEGDNAAFRELFNNFFEPLVKFALQYTNVVEDSEDIVASFFVSLWVNKEKLPNLESPHLYMYKSVKNACLNHLKKKALKTKEYIMSSNNIGDQEPEVDHKELNHIIEQVINKLPEQRRIIFMLIKQDGMKNKEVAEVLNISIRTVENQLYKAVDSIATNLRSYLGYNPKNKSLNNFLLMLY